MRILAIEASAKVAGAAVMEDGVLKAEQITCGPLTHSQTLMPMVEKVMDSSGLTGDQLDVIAFTNGPGSFTGLRIGAATAKGLAIGWNKKVVPLPTLEVLALNAAGFPGLIVPVMDARRNQVYTAVYKTVEGRLETVLGPSVIPASELLAFLAAQEGPVLFLGDVSAAEKAEGMDALKERIVKAPAHLLAIRPSAACALAEQKLLAGEAAVSSQEVTVEYLRKPQAERELEEKRRREDPNDGK